MSKYPTARKAGNLSANYKCLISSTVVKFQNKQEFTGPCHKTFYGCNQFHIIISQSVCHCQSLSPRKAQKGQKGPKRPKKAPKGPKRPKKSQKAQKAQKAAYTIRYKQVTNTVTYYSKKIITTVKCFYSCVPVRKNIRQKINKNRISKSRTERERE